MGQIASMSAEGIDQKAEEETQTNIDYTQALPDECLALIFSKLRNGERTACSLVCKRWYFVEGESRERLSLCCRADITAVVPGLFQRFSYVSKLSLRCDKKSLGIDDEGLLLIAFHCKRLKSLKLVSCMDITDAGLVTFAQVSVFLKKFSCRTCKFGFKGIKAMATLCKSLEEISIKRLRSMHLPNSAESVIAGCDHLKRISLWEVCNAQHFLPLIAGAKNLQFLRLYKCTGIGDTELDFIASYVPNLVELHLQKMHVGDSGLRAVSKFANLEAFHLAKALDCTNVGLGAVANGCRKLQKLHVNGCRKNKIGDDGLIMIAKNCPNLKELVLVGVNVTVQSLDMLASNCSVLERLALCGSDTIGDAELYCLAAKCHSLKKFCIKGCPVSDQGMESLAFGCPKLVKVKVKKCTGVTYEIAERLRANKGCLAFNLDTGLLPRPEAEIHSQGNNIGMTATSSSISSAGKLALSKLTLFLGGSFVACAFLKLSNSP
eukprot:TRINITY_DN10640_c0_g1_i1.p1 TRINITY_DN10640_c0_g1~~TRINITY_DN10640_c0_g1_i1.p1  ORF type:complete len:491 (-),score=34.36 TRINITY_DN10640_c0_g1_i1:84-1556(-)